MVLEGVSVLIPAYKPDARLNDLIDALKDAGFLRIAVVDDGSGSAFETIFERAQAQGALLLRHAVNLGKGAALKTGIAALKPLSEIGIVTCDADGQHRPADVVRIAEALAHNPGALILGVRDKRKMPIKSKLGNRITCFMLGVMTGLWVSDTQTGLRGLPAGLLDVQVALPGDRYEYETNVLLKAREDRTAIVEIVIETVYYDNNAETHFRPFRDGVRIYKLVFKQFGRFIGASTIAAAVDLLAFGVLQAVLPESLSLHTSERTLAEILAFLLPESFGVPALIARIVSVTVNYFVNRRLVFASAKQENTGWKFSLLAGFVLLCSIQLIKVFTAVGVPTLIAKCLADLCMFFVSYFVQRRLIFRKP